MLLALSRTTFDSVSTIGQLSVDGQFECFTLEEPKGDGTSGFCITPGTYNVVLTFSPKFQRQMPLLIAVPSREAIRIHWGNTAKDTEGCILVGQTDSTDFIGDSRKAFEALYPKIETALNSGQTVQ